MFRYLEKQETRLVSDLKGASYFNDVSPKAVERKAVWIDTSPNVESLTIKSRQ
jgi:hypothetical protein